MKKAAKWAALILAVSGLVKWLIAPSPTPPALKSPPALILIAYTSPSCSRCQHDKPTLEKWEWEGAFDVRYVDGRGHGIPLPFYQVFDGERLVYETHDINSL